MGALVQGRFLLEARVGLGGVGQVYRAFDTVRNERVAVKLFAVQAPAQLGRFAREAGLLADLIHPAIVRYVAHGVDESGLPFLAMEWLEGETLDQRLVRGPLSVEETWQLALRVGAGLSVAHALGVVHRDVKPSNLLLAGGVVADTKLLDFGIAKQLWRETSQLTGAGALIGTPRYMSPEQARGSERLDVRSDMFSLGATLYECITGQRAFRADNLLALAAEICLADPPRPRELVPALSEGLDELLVRMLEKDPERRPRDARELVRQLHELGRPVGAGEASAPPRGKLARSEQRVITLALLVGLDTSDETLDQIAPDARAPTLEAVRVLSADFGGRLDHVSAQRAIVRFGETGAPADLAARAARCALALAERFPALRISLATGRSVLDGRLPIGSVVERSAALTAHASDAIAVDGPTTELLAAGFHLELASWGSHLLGERDFEDASRAVLGRAMPFVGRKVELSALEAAYDACVEDSAARCTLLLAPPGMGKTRLWHELRDRLRRRRASFELLLGKADPVFASAPFGLLASVLRRAVGITKEDELEGRRDKLREAAARLLPRGEAESALPFLGELAGVHFPAQQNAALQAALRDPKLMAEQIRSAWIAWLGALAARRPVLLVLEDLHWADLASIQLMHASLRALNQLPLFVLAPARPEVLERFPKLWGDQTHDELRLLPLSPKLARQLALQVLGDSADPALVARLVEHCEGNAFFLQELLRTVSSDRTQLLPDTVMGTVQQRLDALGADAGSILRAASVFGEEFSLAGVAALTAKPDDELRGYCELFEARDVISPLEAGGYTFRHGLVRETCYAALTPEDRVLAHRWAGAFLERSTGSAASVLAEHFDRGEEPARAAHWYQQAAVQALQASDYDAAARFAERGTELEAEGEVLARLLLVQAQVHEARGDLQRSATCGKASIAAAREGSALWYDAIRAYCTVVSESYHEIEGLIQLAERVRAAPADAAAADERLACLSWLAGGLSAAQRFEVSHELFAQCEAWLTQHPVAAWARGRLAYARASSRSFIGETAAALADSELAYACATESRDEPFVHLTLVGIGTLLVELGQLRLGVQRLEELLARERWSAHKRHTAIANHVLSIAHWELGALDEARARGQAALAIEGSPVLVSGTHVYLSRIESDAGDHAAAEREAQLAIGTAADFQRLRSPAQAALARARLASGRAEQALEPALQALADTDAQEVELDCEVLVRLTAAEVLWATGAHARARATLALARQRLLARAQRIVEPELRASFLKAVQDHRRTLELARTWGLPDSEHSCA